MEYGEAISQALLQEGGRPPVPCLVCIIKGNVLQPSTAHCSHCRHDVKISKFIPLHQMISPFVYCLSVYCTRSAFEKPGVEKILIYLLEKAAALSFKGKASVSRKNIRIIYIAQHISSYISKKASAATIEVATEAFINGSRN